MKLCPKCDKEKGESEFYKDKSKPKGLTSWCKSCVSLNWNPARNRLSCKKYYVENKTAINKKKNLYFTERRKRDLKFRLEQYLRTRIGNAIKRGSKRGSAVEDLGCSVDELMVYLCGKFEPGMTWNNHGIHGWHIDHIVPLSRFDLSDREQFLKACHFTNLQPLWCKENLRKGNK